MEWNRLFALRVPASRRDFGHPYLADVADDLGLDHDGRNTLTGQLGGLPITGWVKELGANHSKCTFVIPLPPGFPLATASPTNGLLGALATTQGAWRLSYDQAAGPLLADPTLQEVLHNLSPEHLTFSNAAVTSSIHDANLRRAATTAARLAHTLSTALHGSWRREVVEVCAQHDLVYTEGEFTGRDASIRRVDDRWVLWAKLTRPLPPGCSLRKVQRHDPRWGDPALDATVGMTRPWAPGVALLRTTPALRDAVIALLHPHPAARIEADALTVPLPSLPTGHHLAELLEDTRTLQQLWRP